MTHRQMKQWIAQQAVVGWPNVDAETYAGRVLCGLWERENNRVPHPSLKQSLAEDLAGLELAFMCA